MISSCRMAVLKASGHESNQETMNALEEDLQDIDDYFDLAQQDFENEERSNEYTPGLFCSLLETYSPELDARNWDELMDAIVRVQDCIADCIEYIKLVT